MATVTYLSYILALLSACREEGYKKPADLSCGVLKRFWNCSQKLELYLYETS